MRRLPAVPPLLFQRPRFLRNQAARSPWRRARFRGPSVPASLPHAAPVAAETRPGPWSPGRRRAGDASVPGAMCDRDCEIVVLMPETLVRR
ncbi:hypothetical protein AB1E18_013151 [Capra hircus]